MIPNITIVAMTVCGVLCTAVPIAAMIIFKKKNKNVRISSFFIGGGVFILFALVLEQVLHSVMLPIVSENTVAFTLYAAFAAGIFEETGRFAAFKTIMRKQVDPKDSIMYGIGHGGTEAIIIAGISLLSAAVTAVMTNSMGIDAMAQLSSGGNPETEQLVRSQLESIASTGAGIYLLSFLERIIAMTFHTAMSVMVFESARVKGKGWLFPACIVFHAALDVPAALYQMSIIPLIAVYPIIAILTAAAVFFAVRSYRRIRDALGEESAA